MARSRFALSFFVLWLIVKGMEAAVEVRLVDGKTPHDGRIEVRTSNDPWRPMSSRYWGIQDAYVVCRMLNYTRAVSVGTSKFNGNCSALYPTYPSCYGHEATIELCGLHEVTCDNRTQVASVVCGNDLTPEEKAIKVRLVGTSVSHVGQVEIQYKGTWGAVCVHYPDAWDLRDAHVICRMLGYKGADIHIWRIEGDPSTKLLLGDVGCTGKEKSIAECAHSGWGKVWSSCTYKDLAGVVCQTDEVPPPIRVRLAGGTPTSGRVEVRYHGVWGTIGSPGWGFKDALVVCNMLGYPFQQSYYLRNKFGPDVRGISWLHDVVCNGAEMSIANCSNLQWGYGFLHSSDVGVSCKIAWPPRLKVKPLSNCSAVLKINHSRGFNSWAEMVEKKMIKAYEIHITELGSTSPLFFLAERFSELIIGGGKNYTGYHNKPLEPGTTYNITIRAVTRAQLGGSGYGEPISKTFTTPRECSNKGQPSWAYQQRMSILLTFVSVLWYLTT